MTARPWTSGSTGTHFTPLSGPLHLTQPAQETAMTTTVLILPAETGTPAGKLADAELLFQDGPLAGLKLIGFAVWEGRGGGRNVTFDDGKMQTFSASAPDDHATTTFFLQNSGRFVSQLKRAKTVHIEAPFYQEGAKVFEFTWRV
jgi:hypothetical protein